MIYFPSTSDADFSVVSERQPPITDMAIPAGPIVDDIEYFVVECHRRLRMGRWILM
jgi:hypothetical protein